MNRQNVHRHGRISVCAGSNRCRVTVLGKLFTLVVPPALTQHVLRHWRSQEEGGAKLGSQ